jgi:hypothetical protein
MMPRRAWAALACTALSAACVYNFDNPVTSLPGGALTGRLVLQGAAAGQSLDGGVVKLAWSGLSVPLDPSTGFFGFLDLPDGTFTLVYQLPQADGEPTFVGAIRDVFIPAVSGGGDAVDLGEIQVTPAGTVIGTIAGAEDPIVVAVFDTLADGGDEQLDSPIFSTTTSDGGQFQLTIPVGNHTIVASTATLATEESFLMTSASSVPIALTLQPVAADAGSGVTGNLIFGGPGRGASASAAVVQSLATSVAASDFPPLGGSIVLPPSQLQQGPLPFIQPVRPGRPYDFVCTLETAQAASGDDTFDPLSIKKLPILAGRPTNLGPVPWLPRAVFLANMDGGESSPVWSGIEGSPAYPAQPGNTSTGGVAGIGNTSIERLLAIPLGSSGAFHLLVWTDIGGVVWSADDLNDGGFGAARVLEDAGSIAIASTLVGASDRDGGAVIAWSVASGGIQIASGYQSPGNWNLLEPFDAGENVAVSVGGQVLYTTANSSSLELLENPGLAPITLAAPAGTFVGVTELVVVPCQTDGVADGICLAWTDTDGGLHGALANPALAQITVADAGSLIATGAAFPSIAALVDPTSGNPYVALAWIGDGQALQWGYLTSMTDPTQWVLQTVGVDAEGPALLLPWQGVPLAVYQNPGLTMATTTLPSGVVPSPVFDGGASSQAPGGYADSNGVLNLGLIDPDGGPALFQLSP